MSTRFDHGMNINYANAGISLANATATVTCATALANAVVQGKFITSSLAASATALAFVKASDGTTSETPANLAAGKAALIVHCVNAAGARKEILADTCDLVDGVLQSELHFPTLPDTLTPIAYSLLKNATNTFVWGTTNWNATGCTATTVNVSMLPKRPLVA